MDSDSLIQLLPELLNQGSDSYLPVESRPLAGSWSADHISEVTSDQSLSESDQGSQTSSDQQQESDHLDQDTEEVKREDSPKPVDLDEIEKFLDGITKSRQTEDRGSRPAGRDMAAILREVDELGRRTLSSASLPATGAGPGRPPPSPRRRPGTEARPPPGPGPGPGPATSESVLLGRGPAGEASRRVRFSQQELRTCSGKATAAATGAVLPPSGGVGDKHSLSEPAIGQAFHGLLSAEKRKNLNLTADMILLKQSSLESEIRMKNQWEEHIRSLVAENASLKLEVERLGQRTVASPAGVGPDRGRLRTLEHRLDEQNRLLDGFNAENARLYRELKQLKNERADLEVVIDDLQCDKRLLEARLQAAQRTPKPTPEEQELRSRERELDRRWQEVEQAGQEVARLHDKVVRRQRSVSEETAGRQTASAACQMAPAPEHGQAAAPAGRPCRSPEHVAAAAAAERRALKAALLDAESRLEQAARQAVAREAELKKACEARVRTLEGRLRRLQSSSPARADADLMAALRRLKAQLTDKERALTQTRRHLEKSQRTVTGLQREREKLLLAMASRSPEKNGSRSRRVSPARDRVGRVDNTLMAELQTAIAAVEEENVHLKSQLDRLTVHRDEEISRRDAEIAALRRENDQIRAKLSLCGPPEKQDRSEDPELVSARSDSLLMEVRTQMEAQEGVINHLRETIRRFQEQTRVIAELEGENRTLRETVEGLHWQLTKQKRRQNPDTSQIDCIESKLDEIDRQYRRRAAYLHAILQQLGQCNLSPSSLGGSNCT